MRNYLVDTTKYDFEIDADENSRYKLKINFVGKGTEDWLILLKSQVRQDENLNQTKPLRLFVNTFTDISSK